MAAMSTLPAPTCSTFVSALRMISGANPSMCSAVAVTTVTLPRTCCSLPGVACSLLGFVCSSTCSCFALQGVLNNDQGGAETRVSLLRSLHRGVELACRQLGSYLGWRNCLAMILELCLRPDDECLAGDRDQGGRDARDLTAYDNLVSILVADCGLGGCSLSFRHSNC